MMPRLSARMWVGVGLLLAVAVIAGVTLAPDLGADASGASPAVLRKIDQKNDRAALEEAARMRAESRATAEAADRLRAAEDRGRAEAEATIARFDNEDGRASAPKTAEQ